ncbi:hypothetical protein BN77_3123 [Rhizobium mesoamericanum STM3625]|uniref:Uncharacterized protein n=1 Tax=Rhizobium mesoamericanum STM3625 TaxID=1211777 RepID=K0PHE8_9HYPH|nr:hypothetical protein BN77_3123 [Rhizobium mesoamericanum STM3625]
MEEAVGELFAKVLFAARRARAATSSPRMAYVAAGDSIGPLFDQSKTTTDVRKAVNLTNIRSGSSACRLKEFNEIAGRVYQQDLRTAWSRDDLISELNAGGPQARHFGRQVVDDEMYPVPAARSGPFAIRHRSSRRTRRPAEQQP